MTRRDQCAPRSPLWAVAALAMLVIAGGRADARPPRAPYRPGLTFLTARRARLYLGKLPFRNVGVNIPDLLQLFLSGRDETAERALTDARRAGALFVRCRAAGSSPEQFDLYETDRTRWFDAFGRMLFAADARGMAVAPSLLPNMHAVPDYVRKHGGRDDGIVGFLTPGSPSNDVAVAYVAALVTRYRGDPRVLFWEIGDGYNLEADLSVRFKRRPVNQVATSDQIHRFLVQVGTLIKRIDRAHLVSSGCADMRPAAWHLREAVRSHAPTTGRVGDPYDFAMDWTHDRFYQYAEMLGYFNPAPLDVVSVDAFPVSSAADAPDWIVYDSGRAYQLPWAAYAAEALGKPLIVDAFGQRHLADGKEQSAPWCLDVLQRMSIGQVPLAAIWLWKGASVQTDSDEALSPERTPELVKSLGDTNAAIEKSLVEEAISMNLLPGPKETKARKATNAARRGSTGQ